MRILYPNWPKPRNIEAFTTLRDCDLNILHIPRSIIWLQQEHSNNIIFIHDLDQVKDQRLIGDGSYTRLANIACVIRTADCLPILITNVAGNLVAALHAGWRGLASGIIDQFFLEIIKFNLDLGELLFWFGPAIGATQFVVGAEVVTSFTHLPGFEQAFTKIEHSDKFLADLYKIARLNLSKYGITPSQIYSQYLCTRSDLNRFYSYRAEPNNPGRMCSFIWIKS